MNFKETLQKMREDIIPSGNTTNSIPASAAIAAAKKKNKVLANVKDDDLTYDAATNTVRRLTAQEKQLQTKLSQVKVR